MVERHYFIQSFSFKERMGTELRLDITQVILIGLKQKDDMFGFLRSLCDSNTLGPVVDRVGKKSTDIYCH